MAEYFQQNITTGCWQYFQSEYEPLVYDNLFNRIVKYTARILTELSSNEINKGKLLQIQFLLDEVTDCVCVSSDCDKVKLNPLYSDLADILKLCKVFLSNLTINNDAPSESNFCFLLPMEYVFEDFIFSFIQEHFPELNAKEQTGGFLAKREGKNVFKIKNDVLIEKRKLILDTKYKIRHDAKDGKDGVCQTDLYQMMAYAVKRGYYDVLLLYPERPNNVGPESKFTIESPFTLGKPIQIEAQNIDITNHKIGSLDSLIFQQLKKVLYKNS
ncbi:hypothetical protein F0145_25870 [Adhaeribacter rhizoryzae]|uniref:Restriction endonuclease n=2 Tax=Adhaeribacter rhizoryzae TaxID=2607907 RepID=A0A5M6CW52_9BACT|nr:hypothetical protein F0145_25870 [Adhaeribacter rhizoryzae]